MKKLIFVLCLTASLWMLQNINLYGQTFLNGSFENTRGKCTYNLHNHGFNILMSDCFGFGTGGNLDIIKDTCGYGMANDGRFFIGLAIGLSDTIADALSMKLSDYIHSGHTYTVSFYNKQDTAFSSNLLEVGYTADSLSFGTAIGTAGLPTSEWGMVSFSFTPAYDCRYISIRTIVGSYGWNLVDNFTITETTGVNDPVVDNDISLFPNPAVDLINIKPAGSVRILSTAIKDISGRTILVTDKLEIDLSSLDKGIYFAEVKTTRGTAVKRVIKQ